MDLFKMKNWLRLTALTGGVLFSPILAAAFLKLAFAPGGSGEVVQLLSESVFKVGGTMLFGAPALLTIIGYRVILSAFFPGTAQNFWYSRVDADAIRYLIYCSWALVFIPLDLFLLWRIKRNKSKKLLNFVIGYFGLNFILAGFYSLWMAVQILLVDVSFRY